MKNDKDGLAILEARVAEYVGRRYCVCTGSGTMALTIALEALRLPRGSEIVVPSICCDAVPFAITFAGLKPVFCDVSLSDYNIAVDSLDRVVSDRTRAIVPVHLYGYPARMADVLDYAERRSLLVLEDAAQAFGGRCGGRSLGSCGDISIVSFGYAKIIDAGGGGAVLTDERELAQEAVRIGERFRTGNEAVLKCWAQGSPWVSKVLNKGAAWGLDVSRVVRCFRACGYRLTSFRNMKRDWVVSALAGLDRIDEFLAERRRKQRLYKEHISLAWVVHPEYNGEDGTCFRYSVLTRFADGDKVRDDLAKRGVWVSRLYPALHRIFPPDGAGAPPRLANAESIESRVLNLRVDPSYSDLDLEMALRCIRDLWEEAGGATEVTASDARL